MNKIMLFLAAILVFGKAKASHVPGGNITYECLGGGQFMVTMTIYEDCGSAFIGNFPETVTASNDCGFPSQNITLPCVVFQQEISQLCPAQASMSECQSGSLPGVYMHVYQGIVTLPNTCNAWHFTYTNCCRNVATNSSAQDDYFFETTLNSATAPCNNSSELTAQPIPYVCAGQPVNYSFGAVDPDGDSLVYTMVNALRAPGTSITYDGGFSGAVPIPGITLDPSTGLLSFTTSVTGNYIVAVLITEYNSNGDVTGTITQDFQFEVINCTNNTPEPPANITNLVGAVQVNSNTINMCSGQTACFDMVFTDADPTQNLTIDASLSIFPPGTTYTVVGTNPMTVSVCVIATPGVATYSVLSIAVEDDACPINAFANYTVAIGVSESPIPLNILQEVDPLCAGLTNGLIQVEAPASVPLTFQWYTAADTVNPIFVDSINNPSTLNNIGTGTYLVYFVDTAGCIRYEYVTLTAPQPHFDNTTVVDVACSGQATGSITTSGVDGASPWDYLWESPTGATLQNSINVVGPNTITGLPNGVYTVTITDANGCENDTLIAVNAGIIITANTSFMPEACFGTDDGSINVGGAGGASPYSYVLADSLGNPLDTNTTGAFLPLATGEYLVYAVDNNGCFDTATVVVPEAPYLQSGFTATPNEGIPPLTVSINDMSIGAAGTMWIVGIAPDYDTLFYEPDTIFAEEGIYDIIQIVVDPNGCTDTARTTVEAAFSHITFPNIFTPGSGDTLNNTFHFAVRKIESLECKIYNRWGQIMFESNDPKMRWDGTKNGNDCADGAYFYYVKAVGKDNKEYDYHGEIHLVRKK